MYCYYVLLLLLSLLLPAAIAAPRHVSSSGGSSNTTSGSGGTTARTWVGAVPDTPRPNIVIRGQQQLPRLLLARRSLGETVNVGHVALHAKFSFVVTGGKPAVLQEGSAVRADFRERLMRDLDAAMQGVRGPALCRCVACRSYRVGDGWAACAVWSCIRFS
jgi:hypothetical protein